MSPAGRRRLDVGQHDRLMRWLFVGTGERRPDHVSITFWRVL